MRLLTTTQIDHKKEKADSNQLSYLVHSTSIWKSMRRKLKIKSKNGFIIAYFDGDINDMNKGKRDKKKWKTGRVQIYEGQK